MPGRDTKIPQVKFTTVQYVTLLVFLVLGYGLWSLQVRHTGEFQTRADQNRIRRVPLLAPRGKILDRDGTLIVDNYPSFSALLLRDQMRDLNADAPKIADGLHIPAVEVLDKIRKDQLARVPTFRPIILKEDITHDELSFIEAHRDEFPELETMMVYRRLYPNNGFMAHLIGYVGEVSEDELNSGRFDAYQRGDIVGKGGVEAQYNDLLKGMDGAKRVLVDSRGKEVGKPKDKPTELPVAGQKLKLTVDLDIQKAAEQALEGKNGAIVAVNPRNGEVLAMVSRPTFDPNQFAARISREEWSRLINDPAHPLLNKAIQAQLAPGSVFKVIMSVAGLQEGVAQSLHVNCQGGAVFYGRFFACWVKAAHKPLHGATEISKAITQSCDVFFYTLAERLGIGKIAKWATAVGMGKKTGIDLPNEASGTMPSEEWKLKTFRQKWYAGETISVGIGQGAVVASPIQLARTVGGIAMGGTFYRPHVVNTADLPKEYQNIAQETGPDVVHVPINTENWILITDAMGGVVNPGGTAAAEHLPGVDFAGKTGSAQIVSVTLQKSKAKGNNFKDNGWFVGVAPRRNPEIVVCVLFEQGEHGYLAARAAAQVIKAYVDKQRALRNNPTLFSDKNDPGSVPMAALWSAPVIDGEHSENVDSEDHLHGATMLVKMASGKTSQVPRAAAVATSGTN